MNGSDEAMHRRHNRWQSRFDQPDPYDGSYSIANPQSFNRYAYVQNDPVNFLDPVTKAKVMTDSAGAVISTINLDPWGGDAGGGWSQNAWQQRRRFTTYERDGNDSDEAMMRRYNRYHARFDQPDPYDGSYSLTDPQSFNRYAYVNNDPVNFVDPKGLNPISPGTTFGGGTLWTIWYGNKWDGFSLVTSSLRRTQAAEMVVSRVRRIPKRAGGPMLKPI